jgi:hypothetical protein
LATTCLILRKALAGRGVLRVPVAVVATIVVSALWACSSLFFAVAFTERALSVREVLRTFVGRSPDGSRVELGPYFWMMHTTFLPTLFYLGVILLAWFGKMLVHPIEWVLRTHKEHDKPLALSAAFCGVVLAVLLVLSEVVGAVDDATKMPHRGLDSSGIVGEVEMSTRTSSCGRPSP